MKMKKVLVIGGGLIGLPMAKDLNDTYDVTIVDSRDLDTDIKTIKEYVNVESTLLSEDYQLFINVLPGEIGKNILFKLLQNGKNVVDISFFNYQKDDLYNLDEIARIHKSIAVMDCGVAPGLSNMLAKYLENTLERCDDIEIMVGGLVQERVLPFEYKAMFSPSDVIEICTRPANILEKGLLIQKPAMSDYKHEYFEGIGTLESFLSDGARTFLDTTTATNVREKTLRYPGYVQKIQLLKDIGFFDDDAIESTTKVLAKNWKFNKSKDITVFRIVVEGVLGIHHGKQLVCEFIDKYDEVNEIHSMARTTGYTATAVARLILENKLQKIGLHKPEDLVEFKFLDDILSYLKDRNIDIKFNFKEI